jgi:hypothetical protein
MAPFKRARVEPRSAARAKQALGVAEISRRTDAAGAKHTKIVQGAGVRQLRKGRQQCR